MRNFVLIILFCLAQLFSAAQGKKYHISDPLDIKTQGWNKVLAMSNGSTLLLHMEDDKPLVIKVFDSTHKEVASQKNSCRYLDMYVIKAAIFKGLLDVAGEAVLFMEQEKNSRHTLVRIRFSGQTGKLIEEKIVGEWPSISKPTKFFVIKNGSAAGYAILFATDASQYRECDLRVTYYNAKHETVRDVPLQVDRKQYDYLTVLGAEARSGGIMVSLSLSKMLVNKTESDVGGLTQPDEYDHHMAMYFIPRDSTRAFRQVVDVSSDVYPYYAKFTQNIFAGSLNVLLFSYWPTTYRFGLDIHRIAATGNLFFKIDEDNSEIKFNWVNHHLASAFYQGRTDTSKLYYGMPLLMHTAETGLTTVISETFDRYDEPETALRYNYYSYFGNIGITQLDDDGNEIWGIVLPHRERYKSYRGFYHPARLALKNQAHMILEDFPEQCYQRQFASINAYCTEKDTYIMYNDYNGNFNNSIEKPGDTVYDYNRTNSCYYRINRKKEVTKNYLFGTPGDNEFKTGFIEGADFDEQRGVYATLLQCWKNDNYTLSMAWRQLD